MTTFKPTLPPRAFGIKALDRENRTVWLGFASVVSRDPRIGKVEGHTIEALLAGLALPYPPPGAERAADSGGFVHWWRQLVYVFDLPDPRRFPPVTMRLDARERSAIKRYVLAAEHLAESGVVSATAGVTVEDNEGGEPIIRAQFPPFDQQAGFSLLLRQCDSDSERASFKSVRDILWQHAADDSDDLASSARRETLAAWFDAVKRLRSRSLNQMIRDRMYREEGWRFLAFREERSPEELLSIFNYGDLLHWGDRRDQLLDQEEDPLGAAQQRLAFLSAAIGLAHAFIGFGALVQAAVGSDS